MRSIEEIKVCIKCHVTKPITDFGFINRALGRRQSWCRPCDAAYKREWYAKNREEHIAKVRLSNLRTTRENQARVWAYLTEHPCVDCGETDPLVLEFDHLRDKRQTVSFMVQRRWCWSTIETEIQKCEVRCANCHRRKTARERGWDRRGRAARLEDPLSFYRYAAS